jgi:hypothetical protein
VPGKSILVELHKIGKVVPEGKVINVRENINAANYNEGTKANQEKVGQEKLKAPFPTKKWPEKKEENGQKDSRIECGPFGR